MPPAAASPSTAGAARRFQPPDLPIAEPLRTSKMFSISKLTLGTLNLIVAIISLSLIVTKFTGRDLMRPFYLNVYLSFVVASIIWDLAEHMTLAFRRDWRSIRPAAHVGVLLILWLFAVIVVSFYGLELANMVCYREKRAYCDEFYGTFSSQSAADGYFGIMEALTALNGILLVLHFALFVMACIETDRRQVYKKERKIRHFMVAPGPADGRMYYTPLNQRSQGNGADGPRSQACSPPPVG